MIASIVFFSAEGWAGECGAIQRARDRDAGTMRPVSVTRLVDGPALSGTVVVIDVIRAFTTAAAIFAAGAGEIVCVETLEQARSRKADGVVLVGEDGGHRPAGFDHGNSPRDLPHLGATVVQRTTNGTRGLVLAAHADAVLAAAAINASATARWILANTAGPVTLLCTGTTTEDAACAAAIARLLRGERLDAGQLSADIRSAGREHPELWREAWFVADVEACAAVDRYAFAMIGHARGAHSVTLHAVAT